MSGFLRGILFGLGIGILVAPMRGEELRRLLGERLQELNDYLPEELQVNQFVQQISTSLSQTNTSVGSLVQFANSKVKENEGSLTELAQIVVGMLMNSGKLVNTLVEQLSSSVKRAS